MYHHQLSPSLMSYCPLSLQCDLSLPTTYRAPQNLALIDELLPPFLPSKVTLLLGFVVVHKFVGLVYNLINSPQAYISILSMANVVCQSQHLSLHRPNADVCSARVSLLPDLTSPLYNIHLYL